MINESLWSTDIKVMMLSNNTISIENQKAQLIGLTVKQGVVIRCMLRNIDNEVTAIDLMERLQLSQSTIAGIIQRLEANKFIVCKKSENDKRKDIIKITEKVLQLEDIINEKAMELEATILAGMTKEEQETFNRLLQKALNNVNAARK